jgi:hypothetical protein
MQTGFLGPAGVGGDDVQSLLVLLVQLSPLAPQRGHALA